MLTDSHARLQALTPDQSFIVQAPAGSGKTELLTQRILSLLASNAKSPESVLAITFTKKAAHEMRMRVLKALLAGRDPIQPDAPHQRQTWELARRVLAQDNLHGWHLLDNPQRLQIMTIDSFCASLVRQMPLVSEMGGVPKVSEDPNLLYRRAAEMTLKDLLAAENSELQTVLLHLENSQEKTVDLIAEMLAKREQWLPILMQCPRDESLRDLLEHNLAEVVDHLLQKLVDTIDDAFWSELNILLKFAIDHGYNCPWPLSDIPTLSEWKTLHQWLFTQENTVRKKVDKRQGFPAPSETKDKEEKAALADMKSRMNAMLVAFSEDEAAIQAWQAIPFLPEPVYSDQQWKILLALLHVLPHACAQLQIYVQTQSEIDFSGVSQAARLALGYHDDPSALTLKLDYQLQHILIDEFQDTSLQQFELIEKLVCGWTPHDGRTLFLVGDPMQSIYRFREAEVGLFLRVQSQGLGDVAVTPLELRANFRSDPRIIDWINQHAPQCFSPVDDINLGAISYSPSDAAREHQEASDVSVHATGNLIPCVQQLLSDERMQSIAILVRARTHLPDITASLKAAGLSYQAVELEPLAAQTLIQDLMSLTRALVHLADAVAWLALLRAPFCGFSLADITVIRETDLEACVSDNLTSVDLNKLSPDGQLIWQRVQPILAAAIQERLSGRLSQGIKTLWIRLGGPACLTQETDLRLAESFFNTLAKFEKGGTLPDIHRMQEKLEKAYLKSTPGACRIQVMTLHKSKGLEFDAVLLPELQRSQRAPDQPLLLWEQLPTQSGQVLLMAPIHPTQGEKDSLYDFLQYTRLQKEKHETGRLLYVGMTRAKRALHLFARLTQEDSGKIRAPASNSLLGLLWPGLADEFCCVFDPSEESVRVDALKSENYRLSPTWQWPSNLSIQVPAVQAPKTGDNTVPMHDYGYEQHKKKQQGVLLHRMLYKMAVQGLSIWDKISLPELAPALEAQLRELGVHRGVDDLVPTLVQAMQNVLLDPRGRWILESHAQHEAEAVYGSAVIDRTFIDQQGVRWIIDYKTAQPLEESLSAFYQSQHEQYRSQLAKYAQIFADRGEKNISCALYFPLINGWYEC